ncbi:MAG: hypothetical protein HYX89_08365 [Chloroflexi bacterium]|nr:hypothetical protein [Chloroflexota bacterium]
MGDWITWAVLAAWVVYIVGRIVLARRGDSSTWATPSRGLDRAEWLARQRRLRWVWVIVYLGLLLAVALVGVRGTLILAGSASFLFAFAPAWQRFYSRIFFGEERELSAGVRSFFVMAAATCWVLSLVER